MLDRAPRSRIKFEGVTRYMVTKGTYSLYLSKTESFFD